MGYVELVVKREGRFQRRQARKRLHPQHRHEPAFRTMFMDEARLAGMVHHPNVVSVLDVGEDADGPFLLMDFVEGVPLTRLMQAAAERGERLPLQLCVRVVIEAARGLHAAHELRAADGRPIDLVHRDVSPQNILVGFDGSVRVTDFGIAKAFGNASRTTTGILKGTVGYLSPEQLRFEEPDRTSDLFSLGVILYELLSGERLYANRDGQDGARRTLSEPPPDIGYVRDDVPPELVEVLFELLAKERERRVRTAQELVARLEPVLARLIEGEGPQEIADHMAAHFADERRAQEERLSRLIDERLRAVARAGGRRWAAVLGAAVVIAAGAAALRAPRSSPGAVWAGGWHSCAVDDGALYCWGKNNEGQLGLGNVQDQYVRQRVTGVDPPVSMALGFLHTCACDSAGRLWCWGRNLEGQLGVAGVAQAKRPVAVPGVGDCAQVAAGALHTCVLHRTGRVSCWGKNEDGQTGQPVAGTTPGPAPVGPLAGVAQIAAGAATTCAVAAGAVLCFGENSDGQLGDATTNGRPAPAPVRDLADAVEVAVGRGFACARRRNGAVACWGRGLGGDRPGPADVPGVAEALHVTAGAGYACALRRGGQIQCWGANGRGQLGSGAAMAASDVPVRVADVADFQSFASGEDHSCARRPSGLVCWGGNDDGQLGDGTWTTRPAPVSAVYRR
jgi:serine/threonine-protein kinase